MGGLPVSLEPNPVIEAYKRDVDASRCAPSGRAMDLEAIPELEPLRAESDL
jgi:hypothetical protein